MKFLGPTRQKATDHVRPWELRRPRSHVVGVDFALVRDFARWSPAELRQRAAAAQLSDTAVAILLVLRCVRGLKGGVNGCGSQLSVDEWCALLGRAERSVQYAMAELSEAGLVLRYPQEATRLHRH